MRESVDTRGSGEGESIQESRKGKGGRGSASGNGKNGRGKALCNPKAFRPESLSQLSRVRPCPATLEAWLDQLRSRLGTHGLIALGVSANLTLKGGTPTRHPAAARLVFYLWSSLFCQSNLSSAFHMATWGRFNADMPPDYRQAALRLLDRKGGPSRARLEGRPYQPFRKPWQGKVARRMIYVVPPSLPLL